MYYSKMQVEEFIATVSEDAMNLKNVPTDMLVPEIYQMIAEKAIQDNPHALQFVPHNLQTGFMANTCVSKDGMTIQYVSPHLRIHNYKLHEKAIKSNFVALLVINPHDRYINYVEYAELAVMACGINATAKDFIRKDLPETLYEEIIFAIIKEQVPENYHNLFNNLKVIAPHSYLITDLINGEVKKFAKGVTLQKAFKDTFGHELYAENKVGRNAGYYYVDGIIYHKYTVPVEKKDWFYRTYESTEYVTVEAYKMEKLC